MKLFKSKKLELIQLYSEEPNINALPPESQIFLLQNILPTLSFDEFYFQSNEIEQILLISGQLYKFHAVVHKEDNGNIHLRDIHFIRMEQTAKTETSKNAQEKMGIYPSNKKSENTDSEKNIQNKSDETESSQNEDVSKKHEMKPESPKNTLFSKVHGRLFGNRSHELQQFSIYLKNGFHKIFEEEQSSYEIIEKENVLENQRFPYIYSYHQLYTICLDGRATITCTSRLIAKLLIAFHEEEEKKYLLKLDKDSDFQKQFIELLSTFEQSRVKEFLSYINEQELMMKKKEDKDEIDS